ncbi:hypothetical protein LWI28_007259 [Acer negundo]|uniref:Uncharacterized protein n=1 Tax=Acer negundo TaxID=4023 RepID=A0AAD5JA32_ACENE|nr:hypothetical protein LWI28_007259 [Acer negundo]
MRSRGRGTLAKGTCSKFIQIIANKHFATKFRPPTMVKYHKGRVRMDHVHRFETLMKTYALDIDIWCKAFSIALGDLTSRCSTILTFENFKSLLAKSLEFSFEVVIWIIIMLMILILGILVLI